MTNLTSNLLASIVGAVLAVLIVGGAVAESLMHGSIDSELVIMATAVLGVYFTGQAVRQVNGQKVDALTQSVAGIHARLDSAGIAPAKDGTAAAAIAAAQAKTA